MAKKRRKPRNRPRTQAPAPSGAVRTAARAEPREQRDAPVASPASRARSDRKELARQQREEVRKRIRRAEMARRMVWITGVAAVIAVAIFWFTRPDAPIERPDTLPGELTSEAPWPANAAQLGDRLDVLGLPPAGGAMHEHANVQIFIHGQKQTIPTDIGLDGSTHASLHTHETSGTVHLESQTIRDFALGEFFDVWGVRLTQSCLGAFCNDAENRLRVFVGGREYTETIRELRVEDQAVVVMTYGTEAELPSPIPATFDFSSVPE